MLSVDPPDHTRYRKLVTRAFSAKAIAALRGRVVEIATNCWTRCPRAAATGTVDLVADYASLLPATVIAEMLGRPYRCAGSSCSGAPEWPWRWTRG